VAMTIWRKVADSKLRGVRPRSVAELWEGVRKDSEARAVAKFGPRIHAVVMLLPPPSEEDICEGLEGEELVERRAILVKMRQDLAEIARLNLYDEESERQIKKVNKALDSAFRHFYRPVENQAHKTVPDVIALRIQEFRRNWLSPTHGNTQIWPPRRAPWMDPKIDPRGRLVLEADCKYRGLRLERPLDLDELTILSLLRGNRPREQHFEASLGTFTFADVFKAEKNLIRDAVARYRSIVGTSDDHDDRTTTIGPSTEQNGRMSATCYPSG
jgi:hypothetical protein